MFTERKTTEPEIIEIEKHFLMHIRILGHSGIFSVNFLVVMSLGPFFAHHFGFVMLKFFVKSGFVLILKWEIIIAEYIISKISF